MALLDTLSGWKLAGQSPNRLRMCSQYVRLVTEIQRVTLVELDLICLADSQSSVEQTKQFARTRFSGMVRLCNGASGTSLGIDSDSNSDSDRSGFHSRLHRPRQRGHVRRLVRLRTMSLSNSFLSRTPFQRARGRDNFNSSISYSKDLRRLGGQSRCRNRFDRKTYERKAIEEVSRLCGERS